MLCGVSVGQRQSVHGSRVRRRRRDVYAPQKLQQVQVRSSSVAPPHWLPVRRRCSSGVERWSHDFLQRSQLQFAAENYDFRSGTLAQKRKLGPNPRTIKLRLRGAGICVLPLFCNRDLEIEPTTLKLDGDLSVLKMYPQTENEAASLRYSKL